MRATMRTPSCTPTAGECSAFRFDVVELSPCLLDLGVWLDEGYRIESEPPASEGAPDVP